LFSTGESSRIISGDEILRNIFKERKIGYIDKIKQ
jgi:hypothetical protein